MFIVRLKFGAVRTMPGQTKAVLFGSEIESISRFEVGMGKARGLELIMTLVAKETPEISDRDSFRKQ
jgi:hypothetical protein